LITALVAVTIPFAFSGVARRELSNEINFPKRSPPAEVVVVGSDISGRMVMLRKTVIALLAVA
jgi:hypothetical protein